MSNCFYAHASTQSTRADLNSVTWVEGSHAAPLPNGVIWIRCRIAVPAGEGDRVLQLGRVADTDRTWVNEWEVGSTEGVPHSQWPYFLPRNYFVPQSYFNHRPEAEILIRAQSRSFGPVGLVDHEPKLSTSWSALSPQVSEFLLLGFILVLLGLVRLYPFSREDSKKRVGALIQMGLGIASIVLLNTFFLYRWFFPWANLWLRVHVLATAVGTALIFRFLKNSVGLALGRWLWVWTAVIGLAVALLPGWSTQDESTLWVAKIFGLWGIPVLVYGIYAAYFLLRLFLDRHRSPALASLLMGGMALIGLGGWDILQLLQGRLPVSLPASGIGFLSFLVGAIFHTLASDREGAVRDVRTEMAAQAAVAAMASQVAHDIVSPLAALELAMTDLDALPENTRVLVRQASGRIRDIANHLLSENRKATASLKRESQLPVATLSVEHLGLCVEQIVSEKRLQYRKRPGLLLEGSVTADAYSSFVKVDSTQLQRVLSNLINNAIEAIDGDGRIRLFVRPHSVDEIKILVEDSGRGIPAEKLDHLGKRGYTFGKEGGSGLGLAHAFACAQDWGGRIEIRSQVNRGTEVELILPRANAPKWFGSEVRLTPTSAVVILDDDFTIHEIWDLRLAKIPNRIHFSKGEDFSRFVQSELPKLEQTQDVVFLIDFELKGEPLSGLDWIERHHLSSRAFLVTSRFEALEIRARCEQLGVPLIPKNLARWVPVVVEKARVARTYYLVEDDLSVVGVWRIAAAVSGVKLKVVSGKPGNWEFLREVGEQDRIYIASEVLEANRWVEVIGECLQEGQVTWISHQGPVFKDPPFEGSKE